MKPRIAKADGVINRIDPTNFICTVPEEDTPQGDASDKDWEIYYACGVGKTPVEAYQSWLEDGGQRC